MDWKLYPNFKPEEFACKHTGAVFMNPETMARLQAVRTEYGKPLIVTSGCRAPTHPAERNKKKPGAHALGRAVDLALRGEEAYRVAAIAFKHGFTGIGFAQHGRVRFLHLDDVPPGNPDLPRPTVWSYP